ncbi:hypothetical protein EVAR_46028_1 [Eumeta japonica]|uniref:Uncharacterized protein n=1 Tax=Eumeta variegata TaxID=151549 RepID=A0A4C1Z884_EUMVA|nr:hypothetical protein EVAR_46028_1 [Eumeta japonica]
MERSNRYFLDIDDVRLSNNTDLQNNPNTTNGVAAACMLSRSTFILCNVQPDLGSRENVRQCSLTRARWNSGIDIRHFVLNQSTFNPVVKPSDMSLRGLLGGRASYKRRDHFLRHAAGTYHFWPELVFEDPTLWIGSVENVDVLDARQMEFRGLIPPFCIKSISKYFNRGGVTVRLLCHASARWPGVKCASAHNA